MTSVIKVDTIQKSDGTAPTAADLGFAAGSVLQIQQSVYPASSFATAGSNGVYTATGHTGSITTKSDNSKIFVMVCANGYANSGSGANVGLQGKIGSGSYSRLVGIDGTGSPANGWMGGGYGTTSFNVVRTYLHDPQQTAGTTMTYEALISKWNGGTIYYGYTSGYDSQNTITMVEIGA